MLFMRDLQTFNWKTRTRGKKIYLVKQEWPEGHLDNNIYLNGAEFKTEEYNEE